MMRHLNAAARQLLAARDTVDEDMLDLAASSLAEAMGMDVAESLLETSFDRASEVDIADQGVQALVVAYCTARGLHWRVGVGTFGTSYSASILDPAPLFGEQIDTGEQNAARPGLALAEALARYLRLVKGDRPEGD